MSEIAYMKCVCSWGFWRHEMLLFSDNLRLILVESEARIIVSRYRATRRMILYACGSELFPGVLRESSPKYPSAERRE